MAILKTELVMLRSQRVNNTTTNGGLMSVSNKVVTGVKNNFFDDVTQAERESGGTWFRKFFLKNTNAANEILMNPLAHLTTIMSGNGRVSFFSGTQTDQQGNISSPREYGVGTLNANVAALDTVIYVLLEDNNLGTFQTGDRIWIGTAGTYGEYHENVTVSVTGLVATITLDDGDALQNAYQMDTPTYIASVYAPGNSIAPTCSDLSVSSSSGSYNDASNPFTLSNRGTVEDNWTLVFDTSTTFSVSGAQSGSVGTGSISTEFAPTNPNFNTPYFTIHLAGWDGTWATGNMLTFSTHPASLPLWFKQIVPASSAAAASISFGFRVHGETAQ